MRSIFPLAAALVALAGAPAAAQGLDDWDTDGNGALDESEFTEGTLGSGLFEAWNSDADDAIGYSELSSGLYAAWDANDDGELSVDEWDGAVDLWLGESDVDLSVENWDADGNGVISESEFSDALEATDALAHVGGVDDAIDEDELAAALFDVADANDDDAIAEEEDGIFTDLDAFFAPEDEARLEADGGEVPLIEAGEAFLQLPIPCGNGDAGCQQVATRFCSTLGYGEPIDFLDVGGELYAIRCRDEI